MLNVRPILKLFNLDIGVDGFATRTEQRYMGRSSVETLVKCGNGGRHQLRLRSTKGTVPDEFSEFWSSAVMALDDVAPENFGVGNQRPGSGDICQSFVQCLTDPGAHVSNICRSDLAGNSFTWRRQFKKIQPKTFSKTFDHVLGANNYR